MRHAQVVPDLDRPASSWELSAEGRAAADELAVSLAPVPRVLASPEPKALATAEPLARRSGVEVEVDRRLGEVARCANLPDAASHGAAVRAYLGGETIQGWESAESARARFSAALDGLDDAAVVTHATILALFLGYDFDAWSRIALPDVIAWQP